MTGKAGVPIASSLLVVCLLGGCTGGSETKAASEETTTPAAAAAEKQVDARTAITSINPAIPLYEGAQYRDDLTRRDRVTIRNQHGPGAEVYTLATDDSFPQVYHYYTTYLAQFRAFPAQETYPPKQKDWRTLEVHLNQAMQDPFIPGQALDHNAKQITLQVTETEAEPRTVIRYIITPRPAGAPPAATVAKAGAGTAAP